MRTTIQKTALTMSVLLVAGVVYAGCGSCGPASCARGACGDRGASKKMDCVAAGEDGAACKAGPEKKAGQAACSAEADAAGKATPVITTGALKTLLDAGTPVTVLDARSGKWDDGARIPGAVQLSAGTPKAKVAEAVKTKDGLVVTYCSNLKCKASRKLAEHLRKLGYRNVLEYSEGIAGWIEAGNKTVKEKS